MRIVMTGLVTWAVDDPVRDVIAKLPNGWLVFMVVAGLGLTVFVVVSSEARSWYGVLYPRGRPRKHGRRARRRPPDP